MKGATRILPRPGIPRSCELDSLLFYSKDLAFGLCLLAVQRRGGRLSTMFAHVPYAALHPTCIWVFASTIG